MIERQGRSRWVSWLPGKVGEKKKVEVKYSKTVQLQEIPPFSYCERARSDRLVKKPDLWLKDKVRVR